MFDRLQNSGLNKIVFPSQMGKGKAALPLRFAEWLQNELQTRFGIVSEINENTNSGYSGYGLDLKSVISTQQEEDSEVKEIFEIFRQIGIPVKNRYEMQKFLREHPNIFIQLAILGIDESYPIPVGNPLTKRLYDADVAHKKTINEINSINAQLHKDVFNQTITTINGDVRVSIPEKSKALSEWDKETIWLSSGRSIFDKVTMSIQANTNKNLIGGSILFPSRSFSNYSNYFRIDNPIRRNHAFLLKTVLQQFIDTGHPRPTTRWTLYSGGEYGKEDNYSGRIRRLSDCLGIDVSPYFQFELRVKADDSDVYEERVTVDAKGLFNAIPALFDNNSFHELKEALTFIADTHIDYSLKRMALMSKLHSLEEKSDNELREILEIKEEMRKETDDTSDLPFFKTSSGEIYGFVDKDNNIYLDETSINASHGIHEYTHIWDKYIARKNPELWKVGVEIMKQTSLWQEILNDVNYGKHWQSLSSMNPSRLDSLIASEIHSRLTGNRGRAILDKMAKEKGMNGILQRLKQWMLDFWIELKSAWAPWTDAELQQLRDLANRDIDKALEIFTDMTVRDFAQLVNPITQQIQNDTFQQQDSKVEQLEFDFMSESSNSKEHENC